MYVEPVHLYGNVVSFNDTISYFYRIRPINSVFAQDTQQSTLIQCMIDKLKQINMPGTIVLKPRLVDIPRILQNYEDLWKQNRRPELLPLKERHLASTKAALSKKLKYQYDIYFIITDGREDLKRKRTIRIAKPSNDRLPERVLDVCSVVDEEIIKKLSTDLSVQRCSEEEALKLLNYLAIPLEEEVLDYWTTPKASSLEAEYRIKNDPAEKKLYTRVLIASEFKQRHVESLKANTVINTLQLGVYPVDTVIKFDLEHTYQFKREMQGKKESIRKAHKRYFNSSDRRDREALKAQQLAEVGMNSDEAMEESKVRWQMMFRIRANDEDMLNRRSDALMRRFASAGITLSYELGEQDKLANNLFPFKKTYRNHAQITDLAYFAHFNYLGGLYIGEEKEGIIVTFTKPGELPILINPFAPLEGKAKSASPSTIFAGGTGAGKSQLANEINMILMIYYGAKTLVIDPKYDRNKLVKQLGPELCSVLVLGSKECQNGMFDPYLLSKDRQMALSNAQRDVTALVRAINPHQEMDYAAIKKAHRDMMIELESGLIERPTLRKLTEHLKKYDPKAADHLYGVMDDPNARLFFADEQTDIDHVFDMSKRYNLVTFEKMPLYSKDKDSAAFDPNQKDHRLFAILFSRLQEVISEFMKGNREENKLLLIDEVRIFTMIPGAIEIINSASRQARTWLTLLFFISQRLSDFPDEVLDQTGQYFIGSLESRKEIDFVLDYMKLVGNTTVAGILVDRTKDEGLDPNKKYNFLYCDYNNRKAVTKASFNDLFKESFDTLKKERKKS